MTNSSHVAGGQIAEVLDIPATMVGKLIGKAGETIKQLQYSTNTKVGVVLSYQSIIMLAGSSCHQCMRCSHGRIEMLLNFWRMPMIPLMCHRCKLTTRHQETPRG